MDPRPATVAALLDEARDLITQGKLDALVVIKLLDHMPTEDLDAQAKAAINYARKVSVVAQDGGGSQTAVARFALARLVVLLEEHVARGVP